MRACLLRQRVLLHRRFSHVISRAPRGTGGGSNVAVRASSMTTTTTTATTLSTMTAADAADAAAAPAAAAALQLPASLLPVPGEPLCRAGLRVLNAPTADLKAAIGAEAARLWCAGQLEPPTPANAALDPPAPARPARDDASVTIVPPQKVRRLKNGGTLQSRLAILHALCHIESWAVDLSWDIIVRFGRDPRFAPHLPREFFDDFVRVADDEGRHFALLKGRLESLGSHYGAFEAHDALWHSAEETSRSLPARLAVEHAVHEARGLDVMPLTLTKMKLDPESQALLRDVVYPEEITHCAAGVRWLRHLHDVARTTTASGGGGEEGKKGEEEKEGSNTGKEGGKGDEEGEKEIDWMADARSHATVESWFHSLVRRHFSGSLKPPFNDEARRAAGFDESWYLPLALDDERRRREQAERGRREAAEAKEEKEKAAAAAAAAAALAAAGGVDAGAGKEAEV